MFSVVWLATDEKVWHEEFYSSIVVAEAVYEQASNHTTAYLLDYRDNGYPGPSHTVIDCDEKNVSFSRFWNECGEGSFLQYMIGAC